METKTLDDRLQEIYKMSDLETVCCRQCTCCRVACPQMKYSEALNLTQSIWDKFDKSARAEFLTTCVRYFFSKSLVKPCPLSYKNICIDYDRRPLNCRLYGLWDEKVYAKRTESVAKMLNLPVEKVPLNKQCEFVKRKNTSEQLSQEETDSMFKQLDILDKEVGKLTDEQVASYWNYRTLHDWVLFIFFGESWLINMTSFAMKSSKENLEEFLNVFCEEVSKVVDEMKIK